MQKILGDVIQSISGNVVLRYLFDTGVTISVIVIFLLIIRLFMKKMPRKGMYILWLMAAVRILCPVSIGGIYDMMPEKVGSRVSQTNQNIKIEQIASQFTKLRGGEGAGDQGEFGTSVHKPGDYRSTLPQSMVSKTSEDFVRINTEAVSPVKPGMDAWLLIVWGAGLFGLLLFMAVSMIRNHRRFSDARHLKDNVYVHPLVDNSFVQGFFSPRIYISEKVAEQDREYILCHERKHIKRRDYIVKPVMFIILSVYWFNPFMWAAYYFMMKDMEVSCDEAVIRELGEEARVKYSYLLVSMATGRRGILDQNAAFSVGVVKDRIMSVMKYRKPTVWTSSILIIAVVLCSCSIASTPGETSAPDIQKENGTTYREQSFFVEGPGVMELQGYGLPRMAMLDAKGDIVIFPTDYEDGSGKKGKICKYVWSGENWQREDAPWVDKFEEMYAGKQIRVYNALYSDDGYLYLNIYDDIAADDIVTEEEETIRKMSVKERPEEKQIEKGDYETDCYIILKINEEEGTIDTIQIPLEGDSGLACPIENFGVLGDGSIFESSIRGVEDDNSFIVHYNIYNSNTGEKVAENDLKEVVYGPFVGDDFLVYEANNQQTKTVEINVCDPDSGETEYSLDTGVGYLPLTEEDHGQNFIIGVDGNTILLATKNGVFEAEYGEKEFTKIIDGDSKGVFYLSEGKYTFAEGLYKGSNDSYMTFCHNSRYRETMDVLCYYEKQ